MTHHFMYPKVTPVRPARAGREPAPRSRRRSRPPALRAASAARRRSCARQGPGRAASGPPRRRRARSIVLGDGLAGRPDHRLLVRIGGRPPSAWPRRANGVRDRAHGRRRSPTSRRRLPDAGARRHRRGVDAGGRRRRSSEAEGAVGALVNNAGYSQSGAVETVAAGRRPPAVRDERVRPGADVPARPARDARAGQRAHRQHLLDGRRASRSPAAASTTRRSTRSRRSSDALRFEVAGFGIDVVHHRAGPDPHRVRRDAAAARSARRRADGPYGEFNAAVGGSTKSAYERGPLRGSAAARRRWRGRSSGRSRPSRRRPATG